MMFRQRIAALFMVSLLLIANASAANPVNNFYRSFWLPTYHGLRLNYCTIDGKECGLAVATRYCQMVGYEHADQQIIDYNVGLTNIIATPAHCKGWRCNGFKTIRCVANLKHNPPRAYHYRQRKFVYPRYEHYRVAWCYDGQRGCGKRAAFSFCRRMGYLQANHYVMEQGITATKAIGNQKLCFGPACQAFKLISCYR